MSGPTQSVVLGLRKLACFLNSTRKHIQSTLFVSKSKGLSEILRDTRTSTYQICRIEEKINRTTTFHKWICNLIPGYRDILEIVWKREEIGLISPLYHNICYLLLDCHVKTGTRFSLRDKRLFEVREVTITRVDCIIVSHLKLLHHENMPI